MSKTRSYRIYFHGDPVGFIDNAMTRDEAAIRFFNNNTEYKRSGLMAIEY